MHFGLLTGTAMNEILRLSSDNERISSYPADGRVVWEPSRTNEAQDG